MESGQPVIEQPVGGITVKSAPENRGSQAYPAQQQEYGNVGDPRQKRNAVLNKQIRERPGKEKDGKGGKPQINEKIFYKDELRGFHH